MIEKIITALKEAVGLSDNADKEVGIVLDNLDWELNKVMNQADEVTKAAEGHSQHRIADGEFESENLSIKSTDMLASKVSSIMSSVEWKR